MLLYLTKDELEELHYMVESYFFEFDYNHSPYINNLDRQLRKKLKKEFEYYDTSEQKD